MDELGQRIIRDRATILEKRREAYRLQAEAIRLRNEANEMERLLELARIELPRGRFDRTDPEGGIPGRQL